RRASAEANRLAAAVDHPDILGRTFIHLASAETDRGAWDTARSWAARAVEVAERLDNPPLLAFALGTRSKLAFFLGEWLQARAEGVRPALADALRVQALVDARRGDPAAGQRALDEGLAVARSISYPYAEARLLHAYGEMQAQKGEPEAARQRLEAALAIFRR